MSPILQQFREIETCIQCSARNLIKVPDVFYYAQKAVLHPVAPLFNQETQTLKPRCISALKQIFIDCDHDKDGALSDAELNDFQVKCFNAPLQPSEIVGVKRVVQEKLAEGVNVNGLTLPGFLFLQALFIEKGRTETTWTVLRKFGYDNDFKLRDDLIPVSFKHAPDQVKVPVIVAGCKLDAREDTKISLEQIMSPILQQFREIETCIECSARNLVQVPDVFYYAQKAVLYPTTPLFDQETQTLKPRCISALKQIFIHCDHDKDGVLSDAELNEFQVKCFNAPLQPSEIVSVKRVVQEKLAEGVNVNGLTLPGFLFLQVLFIEKGRTETAWTILRKFGYDNDVKHRDDLIPVSFKRAPDEIMDNGKTLEANVQSLLLESESLKRIMEGMDKEGDQQIHAWFENVKSSEQHLKEIGNEVDQIKRDLLANTSNVRLQLSSKVTEHVQAVKALKERAVELFLHGVAGDRLKRFTSDDINSFTSDLSKEIGAGGFAVVYKGEFPDNVKIAVKVLKQNHVIEEIFMIEVGTLLKATYRNLIKLYGFCFDGCMKALVYEFMGNGSLDVVLLQKPCLVEWETLYAITVEIARALAYLHHECDCRIIHHDIKPSNILLDAKFCPRVTDFGTARIMSSDVSHFTMTSMRGTCGYTAPEMFMHASRVTYKCDVYSFGKMLLDVLGIKRDKQQDMWYKLEKGGLDETLKQCGIMEKDTKRAKILSLVAYWCIQFSADTRPSMKDVVDALEEKMQVGKPPNPFLPCNGSYSMQQSEDVIYSTDSLTR